MRRVRTFGKHGDETVQITITNNDPFNSFSPNHVFSIVAYMGVPSTSTLSNEQDIELIDIDFSPWDFYSVVYIQT